MLLVCFYGYGLYKQKTSLDQGLECTLLVLSIEQERRQCILRNMRENNVKVLQALGWAFDIGVTELQHGSLALRAPQQLFSQTLKVIKYDCKTNFLIIYTK